MQKKQMWGMAGLLVLLCIVIFITGMGNLPKAAAPVGCVAALGICIGIGVFFWLSARQNMRKAKEMEEEFRYREQLFDTLASNTGDVFLMIASEGHRVEYVSSNVERVLGVSAADVREDITLLEPEGDNAEEDQTAGYQAINAMELGNFLVCETRRMHKATKEYRWFQEMICRVKINDTDKYIVKISDRTAEYHGKQALRDAMQIARAANEAKKEFLSDISHDIRTPLNSITGLCTLLTRDADNGERVREHAGKIASSGQHLLGLINDVLDMSKMESGKTMPDVTELSLGELVNEIESVIQPRTKAKAQEFDISVFDIETEHLLGDKLRIEQILINILSNAVKYTPAGGRISLTIRQMPTDTDHYVHLRFTIADNGIGISEEHQQRIYEPFSGGKTGTADSMQGTGLSLALTRELVELMGGILLLESEQGQGTTFTVDLELRAGKQDFDKDFWKKHGISRLLVVDEERAVTTGIAAAMAKTGVAVETARGGYEAIDKIAGAHKAGGDFDLVLLALKMTDMDGLETAGRMRDFVKNGKPFVMLFAYDWAGIEEEAKAAGIDGFLTKPFFMSNFRQAMESMQRKSGKQTGEEAENVLEGLRFLAAEDNDLNAEILAELLKMAGAKCDVAENGQRAVELFEKSEPGKYDMILMDIQMPELNGYEATRAIRACSHPQAETVPIIAMTAKVFFEDVQEAKAAGMDEHLAKPLDIARLENLVRKFGKKAE